MQQAFEPYGGSLKVQKANSSELTLSLALHPWPSLAEQELKLGSTTTSPAPAWNGPPLSRCVPGTHVAMNGWCREQIKRCGLANASIEIYHVSRPAVLGTLLLAGGCHYDPIPNSE